MTSYRLDVNTIDYCVRMVIVLSSRDESQIKAHEYSRTLPFSILASPNLNVSTFATRESSFEDLVETVNLTLSGKVCGSMMDLYLYII